MFDIPDNLQKYKDEYDGGKPDEPVKLFINDVNNLKKPSDLKTFCNGVQKNKETDDFTTYCYDYNDVHSSPYLRDPYKIKISYSNLVD